MEPLSCFLQFRRRADHEDRRKLVAAFADEGPLATILSSLDHQIIYGRRGTGKTHALIYLQNIIQQKEDISVFVDCRTLGSNSSIYSDSTVPFANRGTALLLDVLRFIHDSLLDAVLSSSEQLDLSVLGPKLDNLAEAITEVRIVGPMESEVTETHQASSGTEAGTEVSASAAGLGLKLKAVSKAEQSQQDVTRSKVSGQAIHRLSFGSVASALTDLIDHLNGKRIWILADEWSAIPLDLQPYLADLFRRCLLALPGTTVKIAAIQHRSSFFAPLDRGDYIGIEVGADAAADLNLDDFMVFDNDSERARRFFSQLLFKHYRATEGLAEDDGEQTEAALISAAFSNINAFNELIIAAEGVPRDAINILYMAAQRSYNRKIAIGDIRTAARNWYQRDKADGLKAVPQANELLNWIMETVIGQRRARAFMLDSTVRHPLIDHLFDSRLLHILKRNVSSRDEPGRRFDVYKLDYGCYVDLANTTVAPRGLYEADIQESGGAYVEVPADDYRSIRRAILRIDEFAKGREKSEEALPK